MYARHGTWLSYFDYEDQGQLHLHDEMGSRLASTRGDEIVAHFAKRG